MAAVINSLLGTNRKIPRLAVPAGSRLILSIFYKDTTIYQENRLNVSSKFYVHIKFFYVHNILIYVIISYKKDHFDKHLIVTIWTHTRSYLFISLNELHHFLYIYLCTTQHFHAKLFHEVCGRWNNSLLPGSPFPIIHCM